VLNLAQCQKFASFRPYCIVLPLFWRFRDLEQYRNVCGTDFELERIQNIGKNVAKRQKETNVWHWAKFSTGA